MPRNVRLDEIFLGHPDVDAALVAWREAIEGAHNWDVKGSVNFVGTKDGYALHVKSGGRRGVKAIASGIIPARVSGTEDGEGVAVLWPRTPGTPDRAEGETVAVYNSFSVDIPDGTTIWVDTDDVGGADLVSADYCPEE